ncbi:unnamed protein product [Sphenostylis stenocarpa]|uniref:Uncharacterized protein n=1 Tax=Sphenostylis stenocarpa TaxID=92480 RepID=A0AA86RVX4_9FABA|nr:unnamed protein product [Sphenostylis stenocarpa]
MGESRILGLIPLCSFWFHDKLAAFPDNNMSSIGARSAEIYILEKRQKEKMKRMEEERVGRGEVSAEGRKVTGSSVGKNKIHPGSEQGAKPDKCL